jgi:phosphoenolpyruvate synthase/pyruvate phosphate dikinase
MPRSEGMSSEFTPKGVGVINGFAITAAAYRTIYG